MTLANNDTKLGEQLMQFLRNRVDSYTKSYKSPDPGVPLQTLYICRNRAVRPLTQSVSLGCL